MQPLTAVPKVVRSMLFLKNAALTEAKFRTLPIKPDWFILDVEDNVPVPQKPVVRSLLRSLLTQDTFKGLNNVAVRINSIEKDLCEFREDLKHIIHRDVRALILAKLKDLRMLHTYEDLVRTAEKDAGLEEGHTRFWVNLESPEGILNGQQLVTGSTRNVGVCFGHADYLAAIGVSANECGDALYTPRVLAAMAARAHGLSVVDTPYLQLANDQGLQDACEEARRLGFTGKFALHPCQLRTIHRAFTPSKKEVDQAREIVKISKAGVNEASGHFVGPPHQLHATNVLAIHDAIIQQEAMVNKLFHTKPNEELLRPPAQNPHAFLRRPLTMASPINGAEETTEASNVHGALPGNKAISVHYGVEPHRLRAGQVFDSPFEITVTDGIIAQWHTYFLAVNRVNTSIPFAQSYGLKSVPAPFDLMMNLCMGMSVDPYSESCKLHLGLHSCTYKAPVYVGDTLKNKCSIVAVGATSTDGRYRVVESRHELFNQHGELVYYMFKRSLFDANAMRQVPSGVEKSLECPAQELNPTAPLTAANGLPKVPAGLHADNRFGMKLAPGMTLAHRSARPIGVSENLAFCNFMRNTHSLHFDYARYKPEEVLVSGGYIMSSILGLSGRDLRESVYQNVVCTQHMGKVRCMEPLAALSYIKNVQPLPGTPFEQVLIKTIGLKNVDVQTELTNVEVPTGVFESTGWTVSELPKPSIVRERIEYLMPTLQHRLVMQMIWRVVRPKDGAAEMH